MPRIFLETAPEGSLRRWLPTYREAIVAPESRQLSWPALWICASQIASTRLRDELAANSDGALLSPGVVTFANFAETLLTQSRRRIRPLSPLQRRWLLTQLVEQQRAAGGFQHFAPIAASPGFVRQIEQLIVDLKRRDIWPEDFAEQAGHLRDREISQIYTAYQARLQGDNLYDAEGRFWAAREALEQDPQLAAPIPLVFIDGFTDFTAAQHDILSLLAARCQELRIHIPLEAQLAEAMAADSPPHAAARTELFAKTQQTLANLARIGPLEFSRSTVAEETGNDEIHDYLGSSQPPSWPAMAHLRDNLFRNYHDFDDCSSEVKTTLDRFHLIEASSPQRELEAIAARVKGLLLAGESPAEIVVGFRALGEHADRLRSVFADFGIPYRLAAPRPLLASPVVRRLLLALEVHARRWPYRELLRLACDAGFSLAEDPAKSAAEPLPTETARRQAAAERSIRTAQVPHGQRELLSLLSSWASRESSDDDGSRPDVRKADARAALEMLAPLAAAYEPLPEQASLADWSRHCQSLARRLGILHDSASSAAKVNNANSRDANSFDAASDWQSLLQALQSLAPLNAGAPNRQLTAAEFLHVLQLLAAQVEQSETPTADAAVLIASAENVRHLVPRHLFLADLGEKSFPAAERTDQLYSNAALNKLSSHKPGGAARNQLASGDTTVSEEMLLFFQLVTRPTQSLTLSYPALDSKAQRLQPSPYLVDLQRSFGDSKLPTTSLALDESALPENETPLSRSQQRCSAVARALDGNAQSLAELVRDPATQSTGSSILAAVEQIESRSQRDHFGRWEGLFTTEAAASAFAARFGAEHLWSPSQLERYASCPFRFVAEHVMKLQPLPDLTLESDVRRRGSMLHEALARVQQQIVAADSDAEKVQIVERFLLILDEVAAAKPQHGLDGALNEIQRRELAEWGQNLAEQDANYQRMWNDWDEPPRPRYFEARFGPGSRHSEQDADQSLSTEQPFLFNLGDEQLQFTGQIDRIDVGRIGETPVFNVIDYKSSAKQKVDEKKLETGEQLQLPLYALAAEELLLAEQDAVAWEAGYWRVQGNGFGSLTSTNKRPANSIQLQIRENRDGVPTPTERWQRAQAMLVQRVRELVAGIRRGEFPVFSTNEHCTTYCDLSTICRIGHIRSLEKTWPPSPSGED